MSPRKLTPEDEHIWHRVARTVNNYKPVPLAPKSAAPKPVASVNKQLRNTINPAITKAIKAKASAPRLKSAPQIASDKRVRRGKVQIDRKLDLHDMTQDQAHDALQNVLLTASSKGQRCVLVVTGKGSVSQRERGGGVLRRMLPIWLAVHPLRPIIASYSPAHIRHGGTGAWYVFLKSVR